VDNVLPERPEPEEMVGKNDDEANEDAVGGSILARCGASKGYGNDGLCEV
jgi:hypothetical protein